MYGIPLTCGVARLQIRLNVLAARKLSDNSWSETGDHRLVGIIRIEMRRKARAEHCLMFISTV